MQPPTTSEEAGFSVLEMIVAFTILALVLGMVSQSIALARRNIVTAEAQLRSIKELREAILLHQLGSAAENTNPAQTGLAGFHTEEREIDIGGSHIIALRIEPNASVGPTAGNKRFLTFVPAPARRLQ
ncbi:general secretion pathway protein GspI [Aminobacter sp. Y103A]|uniref:PulJ/GspJ family protein n=1 Tax=Aminobacter sp. Y103A TaxID=1870862 RepID=UPI0025731028|nr:general secretion pathway protein GspI [Aminobacter sp. SS-2016]BBD40255.1 general secretion pathway protein GspI [Aminobacter sp. SS-2016]